MSDRERVIELLNGVPDYKIGYVLAYVQGLAADEAADDAFCEELLQAYESDPEKDVSFSLEECKQEWGIF